MLADIIIIGRKIKLRKKTITDARDDYAWHNDPELARIDAAPRLTLPFIQYLSIYADELYRESPVRYEFAIDTPDDKHIGNCIYYGIDMFRGETELGIVIGNRDYWNEGYGTDAVTILVTHIFRQVDFKRIYLKTLVSNSRAQKCFQKCGFSPYGRRNRDGHSFVLMEMYRKQWEEKHPSLEATVGINDSNAN